MARDIYEQILIDPILRSANIKQVRTRARWARKKLAAHEKATRMSVGDAATVYDRILAAEQKAAAEVCRNEWVYSSSSKE